MLLCGSNRVSEGKAVGVGEFKCTPYKVVWSCGYRVKGVHIFPSSSSPHERPYPPSNGINIFCPAIVSGLLKYCRIF
jgi:hypothetical protein